MSQVRGATLGTTRHCDIATSGLHSVLCCAFVSRATDPVPIRLTWYFFTQWVCRAGFLATPVEVVSAIKTMADSSNVVRGFTA
jgi:hypothetical protein